MTWIEAYSICYVEQSYLAIINNKNEADHLVKLIENNIKSKGSGNPLNSVFLGFHNRDDEGWKTVKGIVSLLKLFISYEFYYLVL